MIPVSSVRQARGGFNRWSLAALMAIYYALGHASPILQEPHELSRR